MALRPGRPGAGEPAYTHGGVGPVSAYAAPAAAGVFLRDLHPVERPREKLARSGPEALSDQELLALALRTGYSGRGVMDLAAGVLKDFPELAAAGFAALRRVKGVGAAKAAVLVAAFELARRFSGRQDPRPRLDTPARVLEAVPAQVRESRKEHLLAYYLNARSQLLHQETVSIGTLSASLVHPREVFSPAVARCAAAVIVAHNHPSGDCSPSADDRQTTRRLARAGEILGIPLLDHVIVAGAAFYSFREHGELG
ncbi:MAG: DNA repair protein RadC [Elusimicrobia bacterium]|nr:DNA repair protein RadC [Elusimicrobiota bacterium]